MTNVNDAVAIYAFGCEEKNTGNAAPSICLDAGASFHRPGIRICEQPGLFLRCTVRCVFLLPLLQERLSLASRSLSWVFGEIRRWHSSRKSPVCFGLRNEAGGGGESPPQRRWAPAKHRRILALIWFRGFALHCIVCVVGRSYICTVHGGHVARLRTSPSPDVHSCHDGQRSPLDRGSAGWRKGRLIWDAGVESADVTRSDRHHPRTHAVIVTQGTGTREREHVFSICITVWKRQEHRRPCKCNYSP